jgi:uncharacterized protein YwgA
MNLDEMMLLMLREMGGTIKTRTAAVKYAYFLGELLKRQDLGYRPHFYGPYSDEVVDSLGELVSLGLVEERQTELGPDDRGFERRRYEYQLTKMGEKAVAEVESSSPADEVHELKQKTALLRKAARGVDYMSLSCAAKAHFLLRKGAPHQMTAADIRKEAKKFRWELSVPEVERCASLLVDLKLAVRKTSQPV